MSINKNSSTPIYIQIAKKIKDEIYRGLIKPGETIGSQRMIEERFSVSTVTVRQAINLLKEEGLVVTNHGKGTYVKQSHKIQQNLGHLQSFSEIAHEQKVNPATTIKKIKLLSNVNFKEHGLPENFDKTNSCYYIERLHLIDQKPVALAIIYIPTFIGEKTTIEELEEQSLYSLMEKKLNIVLGKAEQTIEACPAEDIIAKHMEIKINTPLLKTERISYDKDNQPIEKTEFYYHHSAYSFHIELDRTNVISMWPDKH